MDDSYAAGLIDGEGYIGIVEAGGSMQIRLKVTMTDKGLPSLRAMERTYGGKLRPDRAATVTNRASYNWRLNGKPAAELIERLLPMLLTKRDAAVIALEFQAMVDSASRRANGTAFWTGEMHDRARVLRARIQDANRRGPDPVEEPPMPGAKPLAVRRWGAWWEPEEDLFGPVEFTGRLPTSGLMVAGRIYPLSSPPRPAATPTDQESTEPEARTSARQ